MVPLNFVASEETMRVLVDLPTDSLVGVLALDARRRRLLEAIVQQYSAATVLGALYDDAEAAAGLVEAADLVLVTNAAELPGRLAASAKRLVRVGWTLEPGRPGPLAGERRDTTLELAAGRPVVQKAPARGRWSPVTRAARKPCSTICQ